MTMNDVSGDTPLAGQTALITGASAGLGLQFAITLAKAGAKVALAARRVDLLDEAVRRIRDDGGEAVAVPLDVSDPGLIVPAVDAAEHALGLVSILVNNAGVALRGASVDQTVADVDTLWAVNVRGPFLLASEIARRLIAAGRPGRIVNISSAGAFYYDGKIPVAFYAVTKSAIARMSEVLAVEWAPHHINVNTIAPGFFQSAMNSQSSDVAAGLPRKRIGRPDQLDSSLLYLVAPSSDMVTGACIRIDDCQLPR